jgi:tetratricopeptide (TPR) repeat protein
MKKALFVVIFSLLTLAPLRFVAARAINSSPKVRELKTSAADATKNSAGHARNSQDPIPQTAAANSTATNAPASRKAAGSPDEISDNASGGPGAAAQKTYDAGMALYDSGKLDEAIGAFKQANKLRPDDPQTHYMLGMVYWKAKAYKDAADSFKRAVRLKPDWSEAHFNLGTMFYILGKASHSLEEYKKLVELKSPLANALYRIVKPDIETSEVSESRGATSKGSSSNAV